MTARLLATLLPALLVCCSLTLAAPTATDIAAAIEAGTAVGQDYSGAQAAGLQVRGKDLSGTTWTGADLRGAVFSQVNLAGARLSQANLRGAILEGVSLLDADLSGSDLSGATLSLVNLDGANLADCKMPGAQITYAFVTSTGGTHLPGLRLALQQATGQSFSRPWVAALSGDAFSFVYSVENAALWPGTPFSANPMLAAPAILGLEAKLRNDYFAEQLLNDPVRSAKGVHLLALKNDEDPGLLLNRPVWALLAGRETADNRTYYAFFMPPFGPRTIRGADLPDLWAGPWENLEPVGQQQLIRKPLLTFTPRGEIPTPSEQAVKALRQAAAMISEKRTYGPLIPGEAGLVKVATDLRAVGQSADVEAARRLSPWGDLPRQCLVGARSEACAFLTEAAAVLEGENQKLVQEALAGYQAALQPLVTEWPSLAVQGNTLDAAACARFVKAADLVGNLAVAERRAAEAFARLR